VTQPSLPPPPLELYDIQGLVARGYRDLRAAAYVLLHMDDPSLARAWIGALAVTPATERPTETATHLALSASGVEKLGLAEEALAMFPLEFRGGMTTDHRRRILGDIGANAPEHWLWGGPTTPSVDLMLLLFARDDSLLDQHYMTQAAGFADGGVSEVGRLQSVIDLDGKEHFGFADGISQPTIAGLSSRRDLPSNTIQPGEVILGYTNEYGLYTTRPLVEDGGALPPDLEGSGRGDLGRNGSFLVFRQLAQDVRGFWRWVDQAVGGDAARRMWLASKMVGRWPSGAPLTLAPDADEPGLATANDFTYHHFDRFGFNCPIGAHVRRAHPRDSLDPDPGTEASVAVNRRHRLLRRGREYGSPVEDPFSEAPADDAERGLFFICLVGNIARQFELVQHTWINSPKFGELYSDPDPLVANHEDGCTLTIPAEPLRHRYTDLPRFVTVRGGGYFFLPGLKAIQYLSRLGS
jgi:Dyp-type peroxidase family